MEISIKWNMCRICLKPDKSELVSLYNDAKLAKQIRECTGTAVSQSDGMPDQICKNCIDELQATHEFIVKFRKSDKHIRAVVARTMSSTSSFVTLHNEGTESKCSRGNGDNGYHIKAPSRSSSANNTSNAKDNKHKRLTNETILCPPRKLIRKDFVNKVKSESQQNRYDLILHDVDEDVEEEETEEDMVDISTEFCDSEYIDNSPNVDENSILEDNTEDIKPDYLLKNPVRDGKQQEPDNVDVDLCRIESKSEGEGDGDCDENEIESVDEDNTTPTIQQDGQNDYIIVLSGSKSKLKYDQISNSEDNVSKYIEFIPVDDGEGDTETEVAADEDEQETEPQELVNTDDEHTGSNVEGDVYILPDFQKIGTIITDDDTSAEGLSEEVNESTKMEADDGNVRNSNKERKVRPPPSKKLINVSRFICAICGNTFSQAGLLKTHMRLHRNERRFECELCFKQFASSHNLSNHIRIHTGEKPYECNFCSRRFADRSTHIKHERIHTNEKPFTCSTCGKSFTLSTTLKTHEATHSDEKPYHCYKCDKGFKLPHQLKAHLNTYSHKVVNDELKLY